MDPNPRRDIYARAHHAWGTEAQVDMVIEEVGELLTAISHLKRSRNTVADVAGEIADVTIMLEQLALILGCEAAVASAVDAKMERLRARLDERDERERRKLEPL